MKRRMGQGYSSSRPSKGLHFSFHCLHFRTKLQELSIVLIAPHCLLYESSICQKVSLMVKFVYFISYQYAKQNQASIDILILIKFKYVSIEKNADSVLILNWNQKILKLCIKIDVYHVGYKIRDRLAQFWKDSSPNPFPLKYNNVSYKYKIHFV